MTLVATGLISLALLNTELGVAATTARSLSWVQSNTYYGYKDLNSIHGLTWFTAVSSQNSLTRSAGASTSNCAGANCAGQSNPGWDGVGGLTNCTPKQTTNCNQCGYNNGLYLQANCNCNCNCANCNCVYNNCNCNCDCWYNCCFPAGSKVLMFNLTWKHIELIVVGDMLMGADGRATIVRHLHTPILGNRKMLSMNDEIRWSEEHSFWVNIDNKEWFWSYNKDIWKNEVENFKMFPGLKDNNSLLNDDSSNGIMFAHTSGWKHGIPKEVEADSNTQLYLPFTDGAPIIVDGYVVEAGTDESKFYYANFKWDNERIK